MAKPFYFIVQSWMLEEMGLSLGEAAVYAYIDGLTTSPALLDRSDIAAQVTIKAGNLPHTSKRYRFLALNAIAAEIAGK